MTIPLQNDLLLRALMREPTPRTPTLPPGVPRHAREGG